MKKTDSICVEICISPNDGPLHNRLKQYPGYAGSRERAQYVKSLLIRAFETLEQTPYSAVLSVHSPVAASQTASRIGKHEF